MKVLVASEGTSIDSMVARRLTLAATYIVVDLDTMRLHVIPGQELKDHQSIIEAAQAWGVDAIIAGNIAPRFQERLSAAKLRAALAGSVKVRDALERFKNGQLHLLDLSDFQKTIEEHEGILRARRGAIPPFRHNGGGTGRAQSRHHLQQYGGRGH